MTAPRLRGPGNDPAMWWSLRIRSTVSAAAEADAPEATIWSQVVVLDHSPVCQTMRLPANGSRRKQRCRLDRLLVDLGIVHRGVGWLCR